MHAFKRLTAAIMTVIIMLSAAQFSLTASAAVTVPAMSNVKVGERYTGVKIYWDRNPSATGYLIYKSYDRENWTRIKKFKNNTTLYTFDKDVYDNELCFYRMRAYKNVGGKTYYSPYSEIKKVFYGLNEYITKTKDSVKMRWTPIVYGVTGYEIYMSTNGGQFNKVKTLKKYTTKSATVTGLDTDKNTYVFQLVSYKTDNAGKKNYVFYSDYMYSDSVKTLVNSTPDTITTYTNYNVQGSKKVNNGITKVTDSDKAIFKKFESTYISTQMSKYDKIEWTLLYINRTVDYAYDYYKIEDLSWTDATFNKHYGQCLQYNGAIMTYLAYKGISGSLLCGYRGYSLDNTWQHFWGEVTLADGVTYVMETGNYGKNGTWHYCFVPYEYAGGYVICNTLM